MGQVWIDEMSALATKLSLSFKDYESLGAKQTITLTVEILGNIDFEALKDNISKLPEQFSEIDFSPPLSLIQKTTSLSDVAEIFSKGNQKYPLEFYLIGDNQRYFFVGLYHHSFCDGLGGLEIFRRIVEPGAKANLVRENEALQIFQSQERASYSLLKGVSVGAKYITAKSELNRVSPAQLDGERKVVVVSRPIKDVRARKSQLSCSLNELYLFGVSQVLKTLYPQGKNRTALVPVNLRPRGLRTTLGNFILVVPVELPLEGQFDIASIKKVSTTLTELGNLSAFRSARSLVLKLPRWLRLPTLSRLARATSCIATYVPDGVTKRELCGGRIISEFGMPALLPGHELGFCLITTKDEFSVGITTAGRLLDRGQEAAAAFESIF